MAIKVRFGADNEVSINDPSRFDTIGDILNDVNIKAVLGFGANVEAISGSTALSDSDAALDGLVLDIRSKSNSKG